MSSSVARRRGSDLALLRLWCRSAAVAPIRPLAWEPPYAAGAALKSKKKKKKKKRKKRAKNQGFQHCVAAVVAQVESAAWI